MNQPGPGAWEGRTGGCALAKKASRVRCTLVCLDVPIVARARPEHVVERGGEGLIREHFAAGRKQQSIRFGSAFSKRQLVFLYEFEEAQKGRDCSSLRLKVTAGGRG
jgi:hypothetical protein